MAKAGWLCPKCRHVMRPHCEPRLTRLTCHWLFCDPCWITVNTSNGVILGFEKFP